MITVTVDVKPALGFLNTLYRDQIPFATSRALNATALEVQEAERRGLGKKFTLRRKDWALRNVKIGRGDFATKRRLRAIVRIEAPGGGDRSDILGKFEEGGTKRPTTGKRLAIPDEVKRTRTGIVPPSMRPKALGFKAHGGKVFTTRSNVMVGNKRTVMIRQPGGKGGIFQRKGRGKASELVLLFGFAPRARIRPRLKFEETGRRVVQQVFERNFDQAFRDAVRTAR